MPELPEVETTRRGIAPFIMNQTISQVEVRQPRLRWPVMSNLGSQLEGEKVLSVKRRAKYLLIELASGTLIIHLGMSGNLRVFTNLSAPPIQKHDHLDIVFTNGTLLRFHDPRRFGAVLWFSGAIEHHPLLVNLGPEPLSADFNADYLGRKLAKQKRAIKLAIMDNKTVVGVGNIYANEALFRTGIHPATTSMQLDKRQIIALTDAIKQILQEAITAGGSTLRDFVNSAGKSGYFQLQHVVYGRAGELCPQCGHPIEKMVLGQRSSFYCPQCQR
ncbi:DNA-formamidopyrimidine glycosylase [Snodgrassella communis]|jgi:formamidopyrimidine-DNA glycosylase|uniref:Formamidopyrimidine-DNA glycosylase n=1 Tax=Snodgrassella communis TaxID=2946699 RepID=A0A066TIN9_9NEIS|nr:bifunctional DNA-formamidopyrimidine glycosylase/DNA-(apurinic or apyrimidinic site) lyase [Snodgrassella communis]KDN11821.1 Formamidopyrimidine-DNA glycosylase [Snodgrassella communis]KDN14685.1 Formamidopyrimidine-DNA glycosylase [Snodgrassella communis]PIT07592.1 DNA-formamidopyrimidine glycosylase [Snodgrassella communis]PIT28003.1 DNA-formamidopyrimidine glycosylase [Snodgrassella communis]PIT30096.1 DNA-formamidopyrimidine glycosylase [Snodgrassella communis]